MKKYQGYWCYIPIILCLCAGYVAGGYLTFAVAFGNAFPWLVNKTARLVLMLFGMGILGATTYSTRYWSIDVEEVIYENKAYLPHIFDFFGYLSMLIEGGITGVVIYLVARAGIGIVSTVGKFPELNLPSALVLAYCGGLFHFRVQRGLEEIVKKVFEKRERRIGKDATSTPASHGATEKEKP